jgi:hypothetical protein
MFKKILACFMLLILAARPAIAEDKTPEDESFMHISLGEQAPYDGFLFTPGALSAVYAESERTEKILRLDFESKLAAINLDIKKLREIHRIEIENKDNTLERIVSNKNSTITNLNTQLEWNKWFIAGSFFAGVLVTGFTYHYFLTVTK